MMWQPNRAFRPLIWAYSLALVACDRPAPQPQETSPEVSVQDSAGVQIVENHAPVWDSADFWTVDPQPSFEIGGSSAVSDTTDASHLVWNITAAVGLSDGRIAMTSGRGDRKVLIFERSGELSESFVREGRGPGEIRYATHLQVLSGDTLVVWDQMFGPVGYFDPSGRLLRHRQLDLGAIFSAVQTAEQRPAESMRMPLWDGSFLVFVHRQRWQPPEAGELYRTPVGYMRIDNTHAAHSFGWWEGGEELSPHDPAVPFLPFPGGSGVAGGGDPLMVYATNGDRFEVRQFSAVGELQRIIRRDFALAPITARDFEDWRQRYIVNNWMVDERVWERAMAGVPSRFHRALGRLMVDTEGYLWVGDAGARHHLSGEWSIFDPGGRWLGTVGIPAERVLWIGDDLVIGIRYDRDTDVEIVQGYRLHRRASGRRGDRCRKTLKNSRHTALRP